MTGTEYANLVAAYVARRFAPRSLKVYREVRIGKTIIGKSRCIDIFCVSDTTQKAFARLLRDVNVFSARPKS